MQASTTAMRTSSILSGLIRIDSAMAVAVLLASISISGTIGSASVTSLMTPSAMCEADPAIADHDTELVRVPTLPQDLERQVDLAAGGSAGLQGLRTGRHRRRPGLADAIRAHPDRLGDRDRGPARLDLHPGDPRQRHRDLSQNAFSHDRTGR